MKYARYESSAADGASDLIRTTNFRDLLDGPTAARHACQDVL
jgi:hypothetical protein